mgnify:CR=1 FL=1
MTSIQVHEMHKLEYLEKHGIFNQSTDFMATWNPPCPTDYKGYLLNFLENINKNKEKFESMSDSIIPFFLLTLAICLLVVSIAISIVRKSPIYMSIFAAAVVIIIINVVIEVKKRGEIENASQDIKAYAEILKVKTQGQLEVMIIKPVPKGCYIFSVHSYVIKLMLKYQSINENKNIGMYQANDPFVANMNNLRIMPTPDVPHNVYDVPVYDVQLYGDGDKKQGAPADPFAGQNQENMHKKTVNQ